MFRPISDHGRRLAPLQRAERAQLQAVCLPKRDRRSSERSPRIALSSFFRTPDRTFYNNAIVNLMTAEGQLEKNSYVERGIRVFLSFICNELPKLSGRAGKRNH